MKLIVGLGNPGEKYKQNRHNVGFMFVNYLHTQHVTCNMKHSVQNESFKYDKYLLSEVFEIKKEMLHVTCCVLHEDIVLAKPQTYMNKSGDAVAACITRYTLHDLRNDLIIVHDDLDIPFGKFKIQIQGPKQHNGITDIQDKLRTMDFLRIRIGVDNRLPEDRMSGEEYVLQNFTGEEQSQLPELFKKIETRFEAFLQPEKNCS